MTRNIVVDSPGVSVQISFCGHDNWSDGWVVAHICTPLHTSAQMRQKCQAHNVGDRNLPDICVDVCVYLAICLLDQSLDESCSTS